MEETRNKMESVPITPSMLVEEKSNFEEYQSSLKGKGGRLDTKVLTASGFRLETAT
jgi:hypothetical protein